MSVCWEVARSVPWWSCGGWAHRQAPVRRSDIPSPDVTGEPAKSMKQTPEATEPNDLDELVERAVKGDAVALECVIGHIHPIVVRYCRSRMSAGHRSLASADDIAQEVCMAVLTALPTFRHEGKPFLAFVYGICAHKVADAHRVAARSRSMPVADVLDLPSSDRGPEQCVVASSTARIVDEMLGTLPEMQQE